MKNAWGFSLCWVTGRKEQESPFRITAVSSPSQFNLYRLTGWTSPAWCCRSVHNTPPLSTVQWIQPRRQEQGIWLCKKYSGCYVDRRKNNFWFSNQIIFVLIVKYYWLSPSILNIARDLYWQEKHKIILSQLVKIMSPPSITKKNERAFCLYFADNIICSFIDNILI